MKLAATRAKKKLTRDVAATGPSDDFTNASIQLMPFADAHRDRQPGRVPDRLEPRPSTTLHHGASHPHQPTLTACNDGFEHEGCGRNGNCFPSPALLRACGFPAPGSSRKCKRDQALERTPAARSAGGHPT